MFHYFYVYLFVLPALFICVCIYMYLFTYKNNYIQINMTYFPPGLDPSPLFFEGTPQDIAFNVLNCLAYWYRY